MESHNHKLLKLRAKEWLKSRDCKDIRMEVRFPLSDIGSETIFFESDINHLVIDVVGYRNELPVIGIECGVVSHTKETYKRLSFPVFQLGYLAEPFRTRTKIEAFLGRPVKLLDIQPRKPKRWF